MQTIARPGPIENGLRIAAVIWKRVPVRRFVAPRVALVALCLAGAIGAAAVPALAEQPRVQSPAPPAPEWTLRDATIDGRPVLEVVHGTGAARTVTRRVTPEELPFRDGDCELDCETSPSGCYGKCLRGELEVLLLDASRHTAFVSANTGSAQNFTRIVFRLDLGSGELTRLGQTFGGGFKQVRLSPDGRFLSYLMFNNRGGMEGGWVLSVMDTSTGAELSPGARILNALPDRGMVVDVKNYQWRDASTLVFTAETRRATKQPDEATPRGLITPYVYEVTANRLMTARDRRLIP